MVVFFEERKLKKRNDSGRWIRSCVIKTEFRAFDDGIAEGDVAFAIGKLLQSRL